MAMENLWKVRQKQQKTYITEFDRLKKRFDGKDDLERTPAYLQRRSIKLKDWWNKFENNYQELAGVAPNICECLRYDYEEEFKSTKAKYNQFEKDLENAEERCSIIRKLRKTHIITPKKQNKKRIPPKNIHNINKEPKNVLVRSGSSSSPSTSTDVSAEIHKPSTSAVTNSAPVKRKTLTGSKAAEGPKQKKHKSGKIIISGQI